MLKKIVNTACERYLWNNKKFQISISRNCEDFQSWNSHILFPDSAMGTKNIKSWLGNKTISIKTVEDIYLSVTISNQHGCLHDHDSPQWSMKIAESSYLNEIGHLTRGCNLVNVYWYNIAWNLILNTLEKF